MRHEQAKVQRIAAWWHFVLAIGALGGVVYHLIATFEHLSSAKERTEHENSSDGSF